MRQWEDLAAWQRAVFERAAGSLALGKRQREVARHYFAGASLKEIAVRVRMPEGTLRTHLRRLHRRTGSSDRTGVVQLIYRLGSPTRVPDKAAGGGSCSNQRRAARAPPRPPRDARRTGAWAGSGDCREEHT